MSFFNRVGCTVAVIGCLLSSGAARLDAQEPSATGQPKLPDPASPAEETIDKQRVLGVLPNYRTADGTLPYAPLSARRKLYIGFKDSTDYPVYPYTAVFAALYQLEDSNPSFGQGMKGYAHRYATTYGDQVIGNMLTESLFPILLKEDPRYFRMAGGSGKTRLGYSVTRIFVTKTDAGRSRINLSELVGNATAVAISNAYLPDSRTAHDNLLKFGQQLAVDAFSNVLKEFWPDVKRRYFSRREHH